MENIHFDEQACVGEVPLWRIARAVQYQLAPFGFADLQAHLGVAQCIRDRVACGCFEDNLMRAVRIPLKGHQGPLDPRALEAAGKVFIQKRIPYPHWQITHALVPSCRQEVLLSHALRGAKELRYLGRDDEQSAFELLYLGVRCTYKVLIAEYRLYSNAKRFLDFLKQKGLEGRIVVDGQGYTILSGQFYTKQAAVRYQRILSEKGFSGGAILFGF